MPYKHIAAHLQKTELACRLHYHQLSFGTKRRRRNSSISSARSGSSSTNTYDSGLNAQRALPTLSPPHSPEHMANTSNTAQSPRLSSPHLLVPILPKLVAKPQLFHTSDSLHLITQDIERFEERSRINKDRLARIYNAHCGHFWSTIARDYGDNVSPSLLQDVWRRGCSGPSSTYPPTPPNRSPRSTQATPVLGTAFTDPKTSTVFSPINASRKAQLTPTAPARTSFAISSLLTEDKEVRSPAGKGMEC